jgi:hypothetical protein
VSIQSGLVAQDSLEYSQQKLNKIQHENTEKKFRKNGLDYTLLKRTDKIALF